MTPIIDRALDLVGSLALLLTGITLVRLAKRFSIMEIPPPFNTDLNEYKKKRRWRDGASLAVAGVGIVLILGTAVRVILN
jgi:hypothetical protein